MNAFTPGGILWPEAMAQGKLLDHSWWSGRMRGRITPSDIDAVVESYGCFLWIEITRDASGINDLSSGQRILFENILKMPGIHAVAIARHGLMSHSKPIDTANDFEEVTVYFNNGRGKVNLDGESWRGFACDWTKGAKSAIDKWLMVVNT